MSTDPWAGIPDRERMAALLSVRQATAVAPLTGGITNRNYRVSTPEGDVVVRVSDHHSSALAIDRENEYRNTVAAHEAGVGAPVIEYLPGAGLLVVGWIDGRTYDSRDVADPDNLARIARACRILHAGPAFVGDFDMFVVQRRYREVVAEQGYRLPPRYDDFAEQVRRMRRAMDVHPEVQAPCNNDLLAANFIDDGDRIWIIDYEYSGMNEPSFELGNIWSESTLAPELLPELVEAYWGSADPAKVARARLWALMSQYGWMLWASIQAATSPLDFDYWSWGMEKYDRAEAQFRGPEFVKLLREVVSGP